MSTRESAPPIHTPRHTQVELEAAWLRDRWNRSMQGVEHVKEHEQKWIGVLLLVFCVLFLFVFSNAYPIETTTYALTSPDFRHTPSVLIYVIVENLLFIIVFANLFAWTWTLRALTLRQHSLTFMRDAFVDSHQLQRLYDPSASRFVWDTLPDTWRRFLPNAPIANPERIEKWQFAKELVANEIIWKDWRSHASKYNESKLNELVLLSALLFSLGTVAIIKLAESLQVSIGLNVYTAIVFGVFILNLVVSILWITSLYAYYDKKMLKGVFSWSINEYTNRYWVDEVPS